MTNWKEFNKTYETLEKHKKVFDKKFIEDLLRFLDAKLCGGW